MLLGWLWRVPFLASVLLIAVAVFIRLRLKESPTFVELEKHEQIAEHPLPELFRTARRQVFAGIGLRMAENGGSYLFSTLSITFVTSSAVGLGKSIGPLAVAVASGIGILTVPLAGALSDRFGRIPVYRAGAAFLTLLALPAWYLLSLGNPVLVVVVVVLGVSLGVNTMLGAQCAMLPELFGNRHRYIGVAVSREFSAVIAGGMAPLLGVWFLSMTDYSWWPLGLYTFVLGVITLFTTFITPETRGRNLTLIADVPLASEREGEVGRMIHPSFDISGRIALVTGSSRGIGKALAQGLAEAGAEVVLNARNAEALDHGRRPRSGRAPAPSCTRSRSMSPIRRRWPPGSPTSRTPSGR